MNKNVILYWPKEGNTEKSAKIIAKYLGQENCDLMPLDIAMDKDLSIYSFIIAGSATVGADTWQQASDKNLWAKFFAIDRHRNFTGKKVALFGLGNSILYPNHFVDHLEVLYKEFTNAGAEIIGNCPIEGYSFKESRAVKDGFFPGLPIDEDNQPELTEDRIKQWIGNIK